jgi:hypothetical protein
MSDPPKTGLPKTLESGLFEILWVKNRITESFPQVSFLDLGQSEVAALKFFSAPPGAGSNRTQNCNKNSLA